MAALKKVKQEVLILDSEQFGSLQSQRGSLDNVVDYRESGSLNDKGGVFEFEEFKYAILSQLESNCGSQEMRRVGESCLRLADSIDQNWASRNLTQKYRWPSKAARIERKSLELAKVAVLLKEQERIRQEALPTPLRGEACWAMLLELFIQFAGGAKVSSKSLTLAAGSSHTTGLRQIERLEKFGMIARTVSPEDKRVTLVELTKKGAVTVGTLLERLL